MATQDLTSIAKEALIRAGHSRPDETLLIRAEAWADELKAELWSRARKLKALQKTGFQLLTSGRGLYDNPVDYASDMMMRYASGAVYGAAQGGATSYVTLASSTSATSDDILGREILITSGTGSGQQSQITAYNATTKRADIAPSITTAPAAGSNYLILDSYSDIQERPAWEQGRQGESSELGIPIEFYPLGGNTDRGQFKLWPTPYRSDGNPAVALISYYADLTLLDDDSDLLQSLYRRWVNFWTSGIRWKALQGDDDARAAGAFQEFQKAVRDIVAAETYGTDQGNMRCSVVDY